MCILTGGLTETITMISSVAGGGEERKKRHKGCNRKQALKAEKVNKDKA